MTELFAHIPDRASRAYINIRNASGPEARICRDYCERLWMRYKPYADKGFIEDFPVHMHQRFWEMYLTVTMLRWGYEVIASKPGPDILIRHRGQRVWIEAVTATPGDPSHPDAVPVYEPREGEVSGHTVPQDKIVLRCTAAISAKYPVQFARHVQAGIIRPGDCYIVAVNMAQAYYWMDHGNPPYVLRAVLGVGHQFVTLDRASGKVTGSGTSYRGEIPKTKGKPVDTDLFLNKESARVSGVICSLVNSATPVNMPRPHQMGKDFMLVHNPMSEVALRPGLLDSGVEFVVKLSDDHFEITGRLPRFPMVRRVLRRLGLQ